MALVWQIYEERTLPNAATSPRSTAFWVSNLFDKLEEFLMPAKYRKNGSARYEDTGYSFAHINISPELKKQFKAWFSESAEGFEELCAAFLLSGHKQSVSWNDHDDCYIASLTCNDSQDANYKLILTSRSDNWLEAILLNIFKASVCSAGEPWPRVGEHNKWG